MLAPQDGTPDQCLLGRSITQPRRKRDSPCFNGKDWEREDQTVSKCPCSLVRVLTACMKIKREVLAAGVLASAAAA